MPMSMEGHISWVGKIIRIKGRKIQLEEKRPMKVLDVGIGMGFYGVLTRQLCDWIKIDERAYLKKNWSTELVGIEIFPDYIQDIQRWIYDKIILGDITKIDIVALGKFDIILMMDILEHLNYEDGKRVITELKKISKFIIIAIPRGFKKQVAICGNEYEVHKTGWVNPMQEEKFKEAHHLSELGEILEEASISSTDVVLMRGDFK